MSVKEDYKRERSRIQSYVSDMKSRGYDVSNVVIPKIPQTIKEGSVRKLQAITPRKLREQMTYMNPYTGEYVRGSNRVGVKRIRKEMKKTEYETGQGVIWELPEDWDDEETLKNIDIIIHLVEEINRLNTPNSERRMKEWLRTWIDRDGLEIVGETLQKAAKKKIKLRVNEIYTDEKNRSREIEFFTETMRLMEDYYGQYVIDSVMSELDEVYH